MQRYLSSSLIQTRILHSSSQLNSNTYKYKVHLALFTVALLYAANFSFAKWAMPEYISAFGFIVLRIGMGAVFFSIYAFVFIKQKIECRKDYRDLAISAVFGVALNMTAFFKGLSMTSSINASVLMLMAPVFVVIFSAIGNKTRIKPKVYVGIVLAFIGSAFLVNVKGVSLGGSNIYGDLLIMLNAISYAFYLYFVVRLLKKYNAVTITAWIFIFGFIYVLPIGIHDLIAVEWSALTSKAWFAVAYVIVGITILSYLLNAWALQNSSSNMVGSYIYLQPLLATLIAVALGMDVLTLEKAIFALIILLGIYLVNSNK